MSRLHRELARLYGLHPAAAAAAVAVTAEPARAAPHTRVAVLALQVASKGPAWGLLRGVWQAVQAELDLPAPAIAVSGTDALQLWFSLNGAVPVDEAQRFLQVLQKRWLPEVKPARVKRLTAALADAATDATACRVPAAQAAAGATHGGVERWSAFVSADLVPLFDETPWLDMAPGDEAQATLLVPLATMPVRALADALQVLVPSAAMSGSARASCSTAKEEAATNPRRSDAVDPPPAGGMIDPRSFLQQVLDDPATPLPLRVQAACALLSSRGNTSKGRKRSNGVN